MAASPRSSSSEDEPLLDAEGYQELEEAVEIIDNGAKCTGRLAQLYNSRKFSDVILIVGGIRFYGHKLLLATCSDVFEQMLTNPNWQDSGKGELYLQEQEDSVPVFGDFLRYIYTGQISLSPASVLGLLVLADKYNVPDLKDCCSGFMSRHLVSSPENNKAVTWYQYAIACNSQELQYACINFIALNMDTVIQSPDWINLDKENLTIILQRSDLIVESEYVLLQAVVLWLNEHSRIHDLQKNLKDILPYIRFPMILPEHLAEFEECQFAIENHHQFAKYLLAAYRYHALSIKGEKDYEADVPKKQFMYRNYTDGSYSIYVDITRKAFKTCPRVSSKVEKAVSIPVTICNVAQEKSCKMKITFYPLGYYTTSLWNGQLNLAKSTDQTKLIIAHRGGVDLHEAEISIVMYAQCNNIQYASSAVSSFHVFETYGQYEIENIIDIDKLKLDDSPFIIDGSVHLKVFIRPVSFAENFQSTI